MVKPKKQKEIVKDDETLKAKVQRNKNATRHFDDRQKAKAKRQFLQYQAVKLDRKVDELNREISELGGNDERFKASAFKRTFISNNSLAKVLGKRVKRDKAEQKKAKIEKDRQRREFFKELFANLREYVKEGKAYVKYLTSVRDALKYKANNESFHDAFEILAEDQSNIPIKPVVAMQVGDYNTPQFDSSNTAVAYRNSCDNGGESGELANLQMPDMNKVQFWAEIIDSQMPDMDNTQLFAELADKQMTDIDKETYLAELAVIQMSHMNGQTNAQLLSELADTQMTDIEEAQFCAGSAELELPIIADAQLFAE